MGQTRRQTDERTGKNRDAAYCDGGIVMETELKGNLACRQRLAPRAMQRMIVVRY